LYLSAECKHDEYVDLSNAKAVWDVRGTRILRYTVDATHSKLRQHRTLSAADAGSLKLKLQTLLSEWDSKVDALLEAERVRDEKTFTESLASDAEAVRQRFGRILHQTLVRDDRVVWDQLKTKETFQREIFATPLPRKPKVVSPPTKPVPEKVGFFSALFGGRRAATKRHQDRINAYTANVAAFEKMAEAEVSRFTRETDVYRELLAAWENEQDAKAAAFGEVIKDQHRGVDKLQEAWITCDAAAILEHASLVLDASDYEGLFSIDYELHWIEPSKTLLVNYHLPTPDAVSKLKSAKLVATTGEVKETFITDKQRNEVYDSACYQICLRTIHELFEADEPAHLQAIIFNGLVEYIDRATGKEVVATTMSVSVQRSTFLEIDLARVDPKTCFKSFKGVAAASLANMAAVPPVMQLNKSDKRFVDSREINLADQEGENLAAMPWEDFEHLIRQVFAQVFSARGGEVKVTQASRDGGVDAVAFDPDPIGGGKIVIQAKRYTRTVGVSAVRDLYGTVMNEGANKGILVTTADYGPDAYAFAAGKPLTLLSGANLLHLLGQHGINARINLAEARRDIGIA
jgi:restriction system protein